MSENEGTGTVAVEVKNWADFQEKPRIVRRSTMHTYVLDPTGAAGPKMIALTALEYERVRTVIRVFDNPIAVCLDSPVASPDPNGAAGTAPQGLLLPASTVTPYEFFGPDALFLNSVTGGNARVTVLREYC